MDATAKYKSKNSDKKKKLVKFNKIKFSIITIIVLVLLIGLGVGLYFALRSKLPPIPGTTKISSEQAITKVQQSEGTDQKIGIIFESPQCHICNYLIYGQDQTVDEDKDIYNQKEAEGQFAQYTKQTTEMTWYVVEGDTIDAAKQNIETFLIGGLEEPGVSPWTGATYIGSLQNKDINAYENDSQIAEFNIEAQSGTNDLTVTSNIDFAADSSTDGTDTTTDPNAPTEGSTFGIPMLMWFQGGVLEFFSVGAATAADSSTENNISPITLTTLLDLESNDAFTKLGISI